MNLFQRFAARLFFGTTSSFEAANQSPRRSNVPSSSPRDAHLDLTPGVRSKLVQLSRYLSKNSGFLREMVDSMAIYSVGDGLKPQAASCNAEWNSAAESYFTRWARHAELTGRFNLEECERLACKAIDVDGEIFILKTKRGDMPAIQLIETHRVGDAGGNPDTIDGIRLNALGVPVGYSIILDSGGYKELPAESVLHIFSPDSASQLRGFPTLQHSINHMRDEGELLSMEKQAVKDNSDISRILLSPREDIDEDAGPLSAACSQAQQSDVDLLLKNLGGKLVRLQPGEEIKSFESTRPSPTFVGFIEHLRRDSALGMLPFEFAADSSKLYSAGVRLTVAKADRKFSARQTLLIDRMLRPLWLWVIGDAITKGKLEAVEGWTEVNFTTPRRVTVDAGREAAQNREDVKMGLKTITDHFAELGCDMKAELETRARDIKLILDTAAKYNVPPQLLFSACASEKNTPTKTP